MGGVIEVIEPNLQDAAQHRFNQAGPDHHPVHQVKARSPVASSSC